MPRAVEVLAAFHRLPVVPLDRITGGRPVLVVAPHPDDESLGCGGMIAEAAARGQGVQVAVLTDGTGSHRNSRHFPPPRLRALREAEARRAVAALGLDPSVLHFLGLPDTAAPLEGPPFEAAVAALARIVRAHGIATILATWEHDPHCDHLAAHRIAAAAAARTRTRHVAYPVWGWTLPDDQPLPEQPVRGARLDITGHLPAKRRAIAAHASQHGAVIDDDPDGFVLPPHLLAAFDAAYETFLEVA
ncbi:MAG: PIG-L family deacetylase [Acidisphaera sp.]|nr:PIG-L family deacetylase [Acidisphaera sp.]